MKYSTELNYYWRQYSKDALNDGEFLTVSPLVITALLDEIDRLQAERRWIPVSESPTKEGWYFGYAGHGRINPGLVYWDRDCKEFQMKTYDGYKHVDMDYWRNLPPPPEGE